MNPVAHVALHFPAEHTWPVAHGTPQVSQLSNVSFTHAPPQRMQRRRHWWLAQNEPSGQSLSALHTYGQGWLQAASFAAT